MFRRYAAEQHLHRWLVHCAESNIPELHRLARTLDTWRSELLAYFDTGGLSNRPTEAINALIKKIKRIGQGYRTTTGSASYCTAASTDTLPNQHESEVGYHDWPRRAGSPSASRAARHACRRVGLVAVWRHGNGSRPSSISTRTRSATAVRSLTMTGRVLEIRLASNHASSAC